MAGNGFDEKGPGEGCGFEKQRGQGNQDDQRKIKHRIPHAQSGSRAADCDVLSFRAMLVFNGKRPVMLRDLTIRKQQTGLHPVLGASFPTYGCSLSIWSKIASSIKCRPLSFLPAAKKTSSTVNNSILGKSCSCLAATSARRGL